ncbi:MAG: peptide chain release factor-like protein [Thermoanaerobaculia bacterium]
MTGIREFRYSDIPADPRDLARDCDVSFFRASGPGGQHRNKTETAVRVVHRPTGTIALATEERSQSRNRERAYERLREKLIRRLKPRKPRRRTKVPVSAKEKRLEAKVRRGRTKQLRSIPPAFRD